MPWHTVSIQITSSTLRCSDAFTATGHEHWHLYVTLLLHVGSRIVLSVELVGQAIHQFEQGACDHSHGPNFR